MSSSPATPSLSRVDTFGETMRGPGLFSVFVRKPSAPVSGERANFRKIAEWDYARSCFNLSLRVYGPLALTLFLS